jgi:hypothetical protein
MVEIDGAALVIYCLAIPLWLYVWHLLVGYDWLERHRLLQIAFVGALFVLLANIALAFASKTPNYATELNIYSYVEQNAKTVAGFALAIAIFTLLKFDKQTAVMERSASQKFLSLIFWSFLFAVVGCLPLYWMPPIDGWLTILRHLKTVPFTYSLFILAAAIIIFIREVNKE